MVSVFGLVLFCAYLSKKWGVLPLAVLLSSLLIILQIMNLKIVDLFGLTVTASVIFFPIAFLIPSIITEIFDEKEARKAIILGFIISILVAALIFVLIYLPSAETWTKQAALEDLFLQAPRLIIAGVVTYLISSLINVRLFALLKRTMKGKHLWLRKNIASSITLVIDSIIFIMLAFYGTDQPIFTLILGITIVKLAFAPIDTPIIYLAKKFYK